MSAEGTLTKTSITSLFPRAAATSMGRCPFISFAFTSAPASMRSFATSSLFLKNREFQSRHVPWNPSNNWHNDSLQIIIAPWLTQSDFSPRCRDTVPASTVVEKFKGQQIVCRRLHCCLRPGSKDAGKRV